MVWLFDSICFDVTLLALTAVVTFYWWMTSKYSYWKSRGIPYLKPVPFFGNVKDLVLQKAYCGKVFQKIYNDLEGHRFGGVYFLFKPTLIVRDPELIKSLLIKDFPCFHDRGLGINEKLNPLSASLVTLSGSRWRNLRFKLAPAFTSGKMKRMSNIMVECALEMVNNIARLVDKDGSANMKSVAALFTTDVIGSCAFGLQMNSIKDPDSAFRKMGLKIFSPSLRRYISIFVMTCLPVFLQKILHAFKDRELEKFFMDLVKDTVSFREQNKIIRDDFLQLLIQLKNDGKLEHEKEMTENDFNSTGLTNARDNHTEQIEENEHDYEINEKQMAAQCLAFFAAGFETSSSTISFCLYELATNPGLQDKLKRDIDAALEQHDGKLTYDCVLDVKYLDLVVEETLRKYPPAAILTRICTKPYTVPGTRLRLEEGTDVKIPTYALHHDPDHYPRPEVFDPERFTPENKRRRPQCTYLPFGEGPRMCIGMRFGLLQVKIGLATLLSKYQFEPCSKTRIPLVLDEKAIFTSAKGGIWLKISEREK
ncbi:cytochrome P450 6k1-like [Bacillus rossius redtenbacheri]|uniref:cytochrome P450 6k1-like n=1 Tax=Bacillus rossius redtenbacheri TaxID=93214 RepID=UPI002FDD2988